MKRNYTTVDVMTNKEIHYLFALYDKKGKKHERWNNIQCSQCENKKILIGSGKLRLSPVWLSKITT